MAHLVDTMAYTGAKPWHGLGNVLPADQTIEQWIQAAGLNWTIENDSVRYKVGDSILVMPDRKVLYRSDTGAPLAVVSDRYKEVQPAEVMEFYRDLVESQGYTLETAGALKEGKTIWALARCPASSIQIGKDRIDTYLLFVTACDGTMATRVYKTTVRVVCNNTLRLSNKDAADGVSVPHSSTFNADKVKAQLGIDTAQVDEFASMADDLARRPMTDIQAVNYFVELYAKRDDNGSIENEKPLEKVVNSLMESFKHGPGADLSTANGTQWGALNAVTHHTDFNMRSRGNENRFISSQFGAGAKVKQQAVAMMQGDEYVYVETVDYDQPEMDLSQVCVKDDMARLMAM